MKNDETLRVERQLAQPGLQNPAGLGQHQGDAPLLHFTFFLLHFRFGVVADKQCTCLASKLMWERYPPAPLF